MILVKYGGHAMVNEELALSFAANVVNLVEHGEQVVVVHGGGPQIERELKTRSISTKTVAGLRVTTPEMMDVVETVLTGRVLRDVTNSLIQAGGAAVGITGRDAQLFIVEKLSKSGTGETIDVGQVGEIVTINTKIITSLLAEGFIPVVAPISADKKGIPYNVNADSAAGALAGALQVERAIFLTDVPGLLRDWPNMDSFVAQITYDEAQALLPNLSDGMIPKIAACLHAIKMGAKSAQIIDGRVPNALLDAINMDQGTVITA